MNESNWAIRKIRKGGRVKIGGHWWEPDNRFKPYDGRLDGMILVFGRYKDYSAKNRYMNLLDMWGTKKMWDTSKKEDLTEYNAAWDEFIKNFDEAETDGAYHDYWGFWKQVGTQNK